MHSVRARSNGNFVPRIIHSRTNEDSKSKPRDILFRVLIHDKAIWVDAKGKNQLLTTDEAWVDVQTYKYFADENGRAIKNQIITVNVDNIGLISQFSGDEEYDD